MMTKVMLTICAFLVSAVWVVTAALANPAMLPKHEGYPMKPAVDPVKGQSLANDPGQTNATGERALTGAAGFGANSVVQNLINASDQRVLEKPGAGLLPKVQGPAIKIEPPVKEATKVNASPQ